MVGSNTSKTGLNARGVISSGDLPPEPKLSKGQAKKTKTVKTAAPKAAKTVRAQSEMRRVKQGAGMHEKVQSLMAQVSGWWGSVVVILREVVDFRNDGGRDKTLVTTLRALGMVVVVLIIGGIVVLCIPEPPLTAQQHEERAQSIMLGDFERRRAGEVISHLTESDKMEPTIVSAINVVNAAVFYGRKDVVEKYEKILKEREIAAGISRDGEGEG